MLLSRAQPASRSRSKAPTVLALVLVLAQGAMAAHFVLVRHVFCAEHGELVEGPEHLHAPAHRPDSCRSREYRTGRHRKSSTQRS